MVSPRVYFAGGSGGTQWESGASDPGAGLGTIGDWFENKTTREIFEKIDATTWESRGFATVETVWYTGAGVPGIGIGKTGDWYENTTTKEMYQKISPTVWTLRGSIGGAAWTMNDTAPSSPALGDIWAPRFGTYQWNGSSWVNSLRILPRFNLLNGNMYISNSPLSESMANVIAVGSDTLANATIAATNTTAIGYQALYSLTSGYDNMALGVYAGLNNQTGIRNIFIGNEAGRYHLGSQCLAIGHFTGVGKNVAATNNLTMGYSSGLQITTGSNNLTFGNETLSSLTTGNRNIAFGNQNSRVLVSGSDNVSLGYRALDGNSIGTYNQNVALGTNALQYAATCENSVAIGYQAMGLGLNVVGANNIAIGTNNSSSLVDGSQNVAIGSNALSAMISGNNNVALGHTSGSSNKGSNNTFLGASSNSTGSAISDSIAIGYNAKTTVTGEIRIGTTSQTSLVIPRFTASGTLQTDASGNITSTSDIAIKEEVRKIYDPLSILPFLDGVTYRYTKDSKLDRTQRYAGCIANQWQCYFPDEVKAEKSSGLLSLNYNLPIAFLLETCKSLYTRLQEVEKRLNIQIGEPVSC